MEAPLTRRVSRAVGPWLLIAAVSWGSWRANAAFGRVTGDVDYGTWYRIQSRTGATYLQKGVDPSNSFVDSDSIRAQLEATGALEGEEFGYGANACRRGFIGDAILECEGWKIFPSEAEAIRHLSAAGVEPDHVYLRHR